MATKLESMVISPSEIMTTEEVAQLLKVTPRTIQRWQQRPENERPIGTAARIGNKSYYLRKVVNAYFTNLL